MSINVRNREADRLLDEIRRETGKGTSRVIVDLLRQEHARLAQEKEERIARRLAATREIQELWASQPEEYKDYRDHAEIIGYDDKGNPI